MAGLRKTLIRAGYYGGGIARDLCPDLFYHWRLPRLLALAEDRIGEDGQAEVNVLNRFAGPCRPDFPERIADLKPYGHSRYYYDAMEYLKYFPADLRLGYFFGDINTVPAMPSIVKSRPIGGDNARSVVLNLDKLRHFTTYRDVKSFRQKRPAAVWRGMMHNPMRQALVRAHGNSLRHNIGPMHEAFEGVAARGYLAPEAQLDYRYILSIEGNDVATNLKWIMASQSLCVMPRPKFETWYLESRLKAGLHYAEVRDDFADLDAVIDHYEANPAEAEAIVANANAYFARFRSRRRERDLSLLILRKYFIATGQWP